MGVNLRGGASSLPPLRSERCAGEASKHASTSIISKILGGNRASARLPNFKYLLLLKIIINI